MEHTVWTVGHSNRSIEEFVEVLKAWKIHTLIDIRRFPVSKWEWFKGENLSEQLRIHGVQYFYLGDLLGGFRKGGYINYMKEQTFEQGVERLSELAVQNPAAIMCAEKFAFKCHRRFIARRLLELRFRVVHIVDAINSYEARLVTGKKS